MEVVMIKKFISLMFVVFVSCMLVACGGEEEVLRIHIRANSNSSADQEVKLKVRDNVIAFITPLIAECSSCDEVKQYLDSNLMDIEKVANAVLAENGFDYYSNASIRNEYFPTREYDGNVLPADYYDALILELGSGRGDNWWCVAYPPLCFVGEDVGLNSVRYRSKLIEIINKCFG